MASRGCKKDAVRCMSSGGKLVIEKLIVNRYYKNYILFFRRFQMLLLLCEMRKLKSEFAGFDCSRASERRQKSCFRATDGEARENTEMTRHLNYRNPQSLFF
jgi:hypothetical protein